MIKNVRKGDTVITNGGLVGKVTKVIDDEKVEVEIAHDVRVVQLRAMLTDVRAKGEPVKEAALELIAQRDRQDRQKDHQDRCFISPAGRRPRSCSRLCWSAPSPFRISSPSNGAVVAAWAQRHMVLGLDLQGGSHILLEVDTNAVRKEKLDTLRDDVRRILRENRLGSPAAAASAATRVEFRVREGVDPQPRSPSSANCRSRSAASSAAPASARSTWSMPATA